MTDWRDSLQPASFRGIPFKIFGHQITSGRRAETHEYPQRNRPYTEDLGRKARAYSFDAFVLAPDYPSVADQLIAALEADGPGKLVHPRYGEVMVIALPSPVSENFATEGGMARFSLNFVESGDRVTPTVSTNTTANVTSAATTANTASQQSFASKFSVLGSVTSVISSAKSYISGAVGTLNGITGMLDLSGAIGAVAQVNNLIGGQTLGLPSVQIFSQLGQLQSQLSTLMEAPSSLAFSLGGVIGLFQGFVGVGGNGFGSFGIPGLTGRFSGSDITPSGGSPALAIADAFPSASAAPLAAQGLVTMPASSGQVPASTAIGLSPNDPTYAAVAANQTAVSDLIRQSALVVAVQDASSATYTNQDDATAARDNLTSRLDAEILGTDDDRVATAFRALKVAISADLTSRASALPSLMTITPKSSISATVLAFQLYDDPDMDADIIARNDIVHPGFVPVAPLTVLSYEEAANG